MIPNECITGGQNHRSYEYSVRRKMGLGLDTTTEGTRVVKGKCAYHLRTTFISLNRLMVKRFYNASFVSLFLFVGMHF